MNTCRRGLLVAWGVGLASVASAQSRAPLLSSIDARVDVAPAIVRVAGRDHLVYELHITNFGRSDFALGRIVVEDPAAGARIAEVSDAGLRSRLGRPGAPASLPDKRIIAPGMRAVVYWWLPLPEQQPLPRRVRHVISGEVVTPQGRRPLLVSGAESDVQRDRPLVLAPPLRGGPWVALYDPLLMGGHRTAIYAVNGKARIPARFAVDFVRLHNDGTHAEGDRGQIANWHGYGADVLAVADATVIDARDDIPESPSIDSARRPVPLENASGNFVTLDLGGGRFAFYEHLRHGSIRVKVGDRVKAGDVLAQLGNSGSSSSGPHLHFHIADAREELAGEGTPFVLNQFESIGRFADVNAFTTATRWEAARPEAAGRRRDELPAPNAVVIFPDS
ncbi:MAG TPA: M23 family metallopeptidase, partial [Gemmatimonadaceae bacterium]